MEQDGHGAMVRLLGCISMDEREEYLLIIMAAGTSAEETAYDIFQASFETVLLCYYSDQARVVLSSFAGG